MLDVKSNVKLYYISKSTKKYVKNRNKVSNSGNDPVDFVDEFGEDSKSTGKNFEAPGKTPGTPDAL